MLLVQAELNRRTLWLRCGYTIADESAFILHYPLRCVLPFGFCFSNRYGVSDLSTFKDQRTFVFMADTGGTPAD